jgi:hypothetical protein
MLRGLGLEEGPDVVGNAVDPEHAGALQPRMPAALLIVQEDLSGRLAVADDVVDDQGRTLCAHRCRTSGVTTADVRGCGRGS